MSWLLGDYISQVYSFRAMPGDEGAWLFQLGTGPALLCYGSHGLVGSGGALPCQPRGEDAHGLRVPCRMAGVRG